MIPVLVIDERKAHEICARPGCNLSAMADRDECRMHWLDSCARKRRAKARARQRQEALALQMALWSR